MNTVILKGYEHAVEYEEDLDRISKTLYSKIFPPKSTTIYSS